MRGFNENEHFVTFTSEDFNDLIENWLHNTKKELKLEIMQEN